MYDLQSRLTYNVLHFLCSKLLQVVDSLGSFDKELCFSPLDKFLKMVVLNNLLCSLHGSERMSRPESGHNHFVTPVEPVIPHAVWVARTTYLHVLNQTQVADLITHKFVIVFRGTLVDIGHDASHIVGGL